MADKAKTDAAPTKAAGIVIDNTFGGKHVYGGWPEGAAEPTVKLEILYPDLTSQGEIHCDEMGRTLKAYVSADGKLDVAFNPGPLVSPEPPAGS